MKLITVFDEKSIIEHNIISIIEKLEKFKESFTDKFKKEPSYILMNSRLWELITDKALKFLQWDVVSESMYDKFCSLELRIEDRENYIIIG